MLRLCTGTPFHKLDVSMSKKSNWMFVFLGLISLSCLQPAWAQDALTSIFNGRDLNGWVVPENNIWFKADDGLLKIKSGEDQTGKILWTEKEYGNFVMEFDFKMGEGTVDSGVFIRSETEQIQIGMSGSLKRDMTASPFISGQGYPVEASGITDLLDEDGWNEMTIVAKGSHYTVWLNGVFVMTYESESAVENGAIGIQLHGNRDMAIDYKNIRVGLLN